MERIEQLHQYLEQSPSDSFLIHAIALEYLKMDQKAEAKKYFLHNRELNAAYVPTYFHLGKLLEKLQEFSFALEIYEEGMQRAQMANDSKTYHEIAMAKEFLEDELE